jgi:hypothetical protein
LKCSNGLLLAAIQRSSPTAAINTGSRRPRRIVWPFRLVFGLISINTAVLVFRCGVRKIRSRGRSPPILAGAEHQRDRARGMRVAATVAV